MTNLIAQVNELIAEEEGEKKSKKLGNDSEQKLETKH